MCLQCQKEKTEVAATSDNIFRQAQIQQHKLREEAMPVLPLKVTAHYQSLIDRELRELGEPGGPLYCVAYPKSERFTTHAPGEVDNYVQDDAHMPTALTNVAVQRYPEKLLFLATKNCLGHCQYCFRPDVVEDADIEDTANDNLGSATIEKLCTYLARNPKIREVIISGGDPLVCNIQRLAEAVQRISRIPTVKWFRLHTRAAAYAPELLSGDFAQICAQHRIRLVNHLVHPYEIDQRAANRLEELRNQGVPLYNQFPLVRGINDHAAVIMELAYTCTELGVQMLSMFSPDPIRFGAAYRLPMERVYEVADEVFRRGEAWISNFRVCQDTPIGKVKPEHLVYKDSANHEIVYRRDAKTIRFPDLPPELDSPPDVNRLLYRGTVYTDLSPWIENS